MGRAFAVSMRTEHRYQASVFPFALREVSVLAELRTPALFFDRCTAPVNFPAWQCPRIGSRGSIFGIGREGLTTTLIRLAIEYRDHQVETPAHTLRPPE